MDYRRQFVLQFGGLKIGNHQFDFEIDDRFFEEFEYSEYKSGSLKVRIDMEKQQRMLILTFAIKGNIQVTCDRCLDEFPLPIDGSYRLIVKFGADSHEESDDMIVIPENETRFDTGHFIYEYITLSVPLKHVHPDNKNKTSGCNPLVLKKLEELRPTEKSDPRWDALKDLM